MSLRRLNWFLSLFLILSAFAVMLFGAVTISYAFYSSSESVEAFVDPQDLLGQAISLNRSIIAEVVLVREQKRQELLKLEEEKRKELERLRAFLSEVTRVDLESLNLRKRSNLTSEQLDYLVEGTGLAGLGKWYAEAEEEYGVNALALLGISVVESAWGTSELAQKKNNLFGFQAYDSDVSKARSFESKGECILYVARHISEKYLHPDGAYFNGYSLADVNKRYASDKRWSVKIASAMDTMVDKLHDLVD